MKSNKGQIRKQIKSLEAMKECTVKEFNMDSFVAEGDVCETALCIAGDAVARKYGIARAREMFEQNIEESEEKAREILGLSRRESLHLFRSSLWSANNYNAYSEAERRGDRIGMINAGISELCRYL